MTKKKKTKSTVVPNAQIDQFPKIHDGYVDDKLEDHSDNFCGMEDAEGNVVSFEFPDRLWIEPKDYREIAEENLKYRLFPQQTREDFGRFTNQSPTSECTWHSECQGAEAALRKQFGLCVRNGRKGQICLSQLRGYGITNPSGRGGANCINVMKTAVKYGFAPENIWGQDDIFEFTGPGTRGKGNGKDNSSGSFLPSRKYSDGLWKVMQTIRPIEVIIPRTIEQVICLILHLYVVNVGRKGHAVPYDILKWNGNGIFPDLFGYTDSYVRVLYDSLRTARGCVGSASAITLMKRCEVFDDWFYAEAA